MEQRGGPEPLIGGNDVLPGGRTALILLMLVSMFNYVDRTILSILQEPVKADLGLSDTQLGLRFRCRSLAWPTGSTGATSLRRRLRLGAA
jgi:hypothetical protein